METPVVFDCKGQQIVGMLHLPEGRSRFPAALMLHGFTGNKSEAHQMYVKLSRALASHGIASLRFDFRGCGDSGGSFEDLSIRSEVVDAVEAVRFLARHRHVNSRRLALVGLSMGGAVASYLVGRERTRFKTMALWAPVADGTGILDGFSTPEAVAALAETGITDHGANLVGVQFIRQFAEMKPLREIVKSRCPVLLVHGSRDEVVPAHNSDQYEKALLTHKRLVKKVIIAGADHTFNRHVWEQRAITETVDWLSETL
jgi:dipeptidyl aminopeptidase/acylaminoacyl peptidase